MGETMIRWPACAAALAAVVALSACSRSAPPEQPVGPPPLAEQAAPPLAGGPSSQAESDRALAEAAVAAGDTASTAPSLTAEPVSYETGYGRIYRDAYDHRGPGYAQRERQLAYEQRLEQERHAARERYLAHERILVGKHRPTTRHRYVRHWYYRHHQLVFEHPQRSRPLRQVRPPAAVAAPAPQLAGKPAPSPARLVRPRPIVMKPAARPVVLQQPQVKPIDHSLALPLITAQAPPAITPDQAAAAPAVDLGTQLGELTSAAALDMKNTRLDLPAALSTGGEGKVTLTLPPDLLATIQAKATAVGLGASGRKVFITAKLAGQGYEITPNQGQTARMDAGPTVFAWDVKPSAAPGGVLTADMTGSLQGLGEAKTFALGAVTAQILGPAQAAAAPVSAPAAASQVRLPDLAHLQLGGLKLPDLSRLKLHDLAIPGHPTVTVPGLGPVASEKVVGSGLIALVLIFLVAIVRSASARRERAERRKRFHSFEAAQFGDEHL